MVGIPVAKLFASQGKYNLRIQTRDPNHERSRELATLPNTTLIAGRADNEADLRRAFNGVTAAFVNTNGFAIGEKAELYWGMRIYEIAKEEKSMRHYVWSNLDYALKLGGYNEKYKTGHYDGKGGPVLSTLLISREGRGMDPTSTLWRRCRYFRMDNLHQWSLYGDAGQRWVVCSTRASQWDVCIC